ncbi:histidine phosphatase family protein [Streptomyces sp. NPDC005438]|uniref:histidine phosphatase family protein n=1 Tax=Streptomyces sp. NPDC005438 TaxID=3156880 RepID=UPI0033B5C328
MSVLLLVRHGQASFGADDYDELTPLGQEQATLLGASLARRGLTPDLLVRGGLRRHQQTLVHLVAGADWAAVPVEVDRRWDEFDHRQVFAAHRPEYLAPGRLAAELARGPQAARDLQHLFEEATTRWWSGDHDGDYPEPFPRFADRVDRALAQTARLTPPGGTALVVSSGGPLSAVASQLLAGNGSLWPRLNPVAVNTGVSKVVAGSRGLTLVTVNAHEHLDHRRQLLTYR